MGKEQEDGTTKKGSGEEGDGEVMGKMGYKKEKNEEGDIQCGGEEEEKKMGEERQ